ncbi:alpha-1,2-Mannosidase [Mycena venus]|uniref:alpha-1,2-Mannosidase n=1 Tax=Mycena venus TaxID=2733690 RepID=A0A8H6XEH8_9AGAR|nr:alpha-1,2-Mannosidase [Mycena venus]
MRRRTLQYLVLLAICGLSVHLYFNRSFSLPSKPDWMDEYWGSEAEGESERVIPDGKKPPSRPYDVKPPPPPPQKPAPATGTGSGPGRVSSPSERPNRLLADARKRDAVVDAFKHAWSAYETDAMGSDEYHPLSHRGSNLGGGGIGYTVVDALDTMLLMGPALDAEYKRARKWVEESLTFDRTGQFSTFETTIRVLGGLLSAYYLSGGDELYLHHAADLGDRMLPVFESKSGLPASHVNLGGKSAATGGGVSISEATTLQLEFRYLAEITGRPIFWHKAEKVMQVVNKARIPNGLAPIDMTADGSFARSGIRLGSNGDSYYEYLLKQYIQTNRTEPVYLQMYADAMQGVHENLVFKTPRDGLTYHRGAAAAGGWREGLEDREEETKRWRRIYRCRFVASLPPFFAERILPPGSPNPNRNISHASSPAPSCSAPPPHTRSTPTPSAKFDPSLTRPGVSLPPKMEELTQAGQRDWKTGVAFLEGCMDTHKTATGLSPEGVNFRTSADPPKEGERDWYIKGANKEGSPPYDARYMLRPEISESVFLAWRLTGDARYRSYAWDIFSAIERHCRLPGGRSETLKYLYLTFADENVLDLNEVVFNTEAHPLPIFNPSIKPLFTKYS